MASGFTSRICTVSYQLGMANIIEDESASGTGDNKWLEDIL